MSQPDLLSWRPSETPAKFRRAKGDPRDYAAEWAAFVEAHPAVADDMLARCRHMAATCAPRVEVNNLFAVAREMHRVTLNNSWRAAAADWLVEHEPQLDDLIERRKRKATK